jgi:hypothetical protein
MYNSANLFLTSSTSRYNGKKIIVVVKGVRKSEYPRVKDWNWTLFAIFCCYDYIPKNSLKMKYLIWLTVSEVSVPGHGFHCFWTSDEVDHHGGQKLFSSWKPGSRKQEGVVEDGCAITDLLRPTKLHLLASSTSHWWYQTMD